MTESGRLEEIAFDLYERYVLLEQIGKFFQPSETTYNVLDVGGHTEALWPGFCSLAGVFIPQAKVTVVDMIPTAELQNYVRASGVQLPFRDGAFDLVCSLDTLEHIPAEHRPAFLSELLRVTRDGLYLAFPFDSASNRWAESMVVQYTGVTLNRPIPALMEHLQFGLPDRGAVSRLLSSESYACLPFAQGNTDVWLLMMLTYHTLRIPGTDFVQELNRRFNQAYAAQDWAEPHYRAGYLLSKRRNIVELEAVRGSFGSGQSAADLQSVLTMCQLFISIAQNGRVTADKDRHIRNLDNDLADARVYREKWGEVAAMLGRLEEEVSGIRGSVAAQETLADWPRERLSRLLEAAHRARASELEVKLAKVTSQLDGMAAEVARAEQMAAQAATAQADQMASQFAMIRERIDGLRSNLEFQARLDGRMRDLEIGLVTNKRSIQAIYESRIWKAFSSLGGLLLRLTGRGPETDRAAPWSRQEAAPAVEPVAKPRHDTAEDFVALVCDYPGDEQILAARDVVEIRGWVLAKSGIDRVSIQINGEAPVAASYGIPRPDVERSYAGVTGADQSGYRLFWDPTGLPDGPCTVRVTAVARGGQTREAMRTVVIDSKAPLGYGAWITRHEPNEEGLRELRREAGNLAVCPLISIAVPVYKTPLALLTRCMDSVLEQTYPKWELCLTDDGSHDAGVTALLRKYAERDSRIRVAALEQNRGISAATNEALRLSTGEYFALLDHDDELPPFALSEVVRAIHDNPDTEIFYSDEDKIDEEGGRYDAFFKPDWSPELFHSCNYICHFVVMRRSLAEKLGGLDQNYGGAQDYEFLLRASEQTQAIKRIPKILYHWRAVGGSTAKALTEKPEASGDGERALRSHLERTAPGAQVEEVGACRYRVRYPIAGDARVSILIPTGGHKSVFRAVEDVLEKTTYKNYEILLIDNSRAARVEEYATRLAARKAPVKYFDWREKPFNFAAMNNAAVGAATSPYILFLNDDTSVIGGEWLGAMLEYAQQPKVGAVGAQLWYPNHLIQHAGVVMGLYGNCSHAFKGLPGELPHYYFDLPNVIRNCSAVTGACLLVARDKFFEAGGFDEVNLAVAFQDVDLCLKLLELGYRNVYTPYAKLYHYESASKTEKDKIPDPVEDAFMKRKWARYIADDPYYNPNLSRQREDFSLATD